MARGGVRTALAKVLRGLPGGGEPRAGQVEMAEAVAASIADGTHLVVQAGTGTGKSLAYLVPALLSGRKVVVATATKALQDQLAHKDLPLVCDRIGLRASFAVLKGRSNYLCRQRAREITGDAKASDVIDASLPDIPWHGASIEAPGPDDSTRSNGQVRAILDWAARSRTGDRAELDFEPSPAAWASVSVSSLECPGAQECPSGDACFAEDARSCAAEADIVVVNTHLYGSHVASGGGLLPEHEVAVFDEAHALEDVICASLGREVSSRRLRALARALAGPAGRERGVAEALSGAADRLDSTLSQLLGKRVVRNAHDEVDTALLLASRHVADAMSQLRELTHSQAEMLASRGSGSAGAGQARALVAASHLLEDLSAVAEVRDGRVAWVEGTARAPLLRVAPVEVAPLLEPLWDRVTAILASATIPAGLAQRVGIDEQRCRTLDVGSPFPYATNALLYCATHLPDRRSPGFDSAIHAEIASLIKAAGGRTLALFTSWRAMQAAAQALSAELEYTILTQADLPKPALIEAFSADESACLFATMGFWQGVDVPGPTLSLVIIDRIPFPRPDDPLIEARRERAGQDAFRTVDLPRAATLLAQGAGRLIRSSTDRGVVAVLDPRLARASYRWPLVRSLPPMPRTRHLHEVKAFLAQACPGGGDPITSRR